MVKRNWFDTLNQALESENLVDSYPLGLNIGYGEHVLYTTDDGEHVTIYRESDGRYERPIHYSVNF
jgi:hypothetical protein